MTPRDRQPLLLFTLPQMAAIGEATSAEWRVLLMLRFIEGIRPACVRDCGDASYLDSLIKDLGGPTQ